LNKNSLICSLFNSRFPSNVFNVLFLIPFLCFYLLTSHMDRQIFASLLPLPSHCWGIIPQAASFLLSCPSENYLLPLSLFPIGPAYFHIQIWIVQDVFNFTALSIHYREMFQERYPL
jgi:hypothetical protein